MKNYFLPIIILFIGLIPINAQSQFFFTGRSCVPPSPTPSSFMQYIDIPVSLYTGVADINIPVCSLNGKDINVPVNLTYHASGIKVQSISNWVGLGWSLNAGGFISRVMRDLPDESDNGFLGKNRNLTLFNAPNLDYLRDIMEGRADGQPDLFYFQVNGLSGKFVFNESGDVVLLPYQPIKIKPAIGPKGIGYWEITDTNGTVYILGQTDGSRESTTSKLVKEDDSKKKTYVSTWYLDKIQSVYNDVVNFKYSIGSKISYTIYNKQIMSYSSAEKSDSQTGDASISVEILNPKYLLSISNSLGTINFSASASRLDLSNAKKLNSISKSNTSGDLIELYIFSYTYYDTEDGLEKKLMLTEFNRADVPSYKFHYFIDEKLPSRSSYIFDSWGYNNGCDPLATTVNRDPVLNKTKAYSLIQMDLPTGGFQKLEYELNDYLIDGNEHYAGGLRVAKTINKDNVTGNEITRSYTYKDMVTNLSSGQIYDKPEYSISYVLKSTMCVPVNVLNGKIIYDCRDWNPCYKNLFVLPVNQLEDVNGLHVGYSTVKISNGLGSEVYNYSNFLDRPDINQSVYKIKGGGNNDKY